MANVKVTLELTEEELKTVDEIASNLETDRDGALRDMVEFYMDNYRAECAEAAEADRQLQAGETYSHEEVVAKYESWKASVLAKSKEAA